MDISPELLASLTSGNVGQSLLWLQNWLANAQRGDPENLVQACPTNVRGRLVLLLRDLISRYPRTLMGAPVLFHYRTDQPDQNAWVHLPCPAAVNRAPCADLIFEGWLPLTTRLPLPHPLTPQDVAHQIPVDQIGASVALFRSPSSLFDLDEIIIPDAWWASIFSRGAPGGVFLSARMILPYPDALDAARVLLACATGEPEPKASGFLTDHAWNWAHKAGFEFRGACGRLADSQAY